MGMPRAILIDRGAHFSGAEFNWLSSLFGIALVTAPTRAHYQLGLIEKNQQLVTDSFVALWSQNTTKWSKHEVLSMAVTAKNITPLSPTTISPLQLLTGREDLLPWTSQLDSAHQIQAENSKLSWNQLVLKRQQGIQQMRTNMIAPSAQKLL